MKVEVQSIKQKMTTDKVIEMEDVPEQETRNAQTLNEAITEMSFTERFVEGISLILLGKTPKLQKWHEMQLKTIENLRNDLRDTETKIKDMEEKQKKQIEDMEEKQKQQAQTTADTVMKLERMIRELQEKDQAREQRELTMQRMATQAHL